MTKSGVEVVHKLRVAFNRASTIEQLGQALVTTIRGAIEFDRFNIGLIEQPAYQFHDAFVYGDNVAGRRVGHRRTLDGTVVEEAMRTAHGYYFGHSDLAPWLERFPGFAPVYDSGIRAMLAAPIRDRRDVLASLVFASRDANAYTPASLSLAMSVAHSMPHRLLASARPDATSARPARRRRL